MAVSVGSGPPEVAGRACSGLKISNGQAPLSLSSCGQPAVCGARRTGRPRPTAPVPLPDAFTSRPAWRSSRKCRRGKHDQRDCFDDDPAARRDTGAPRCDLRVSVPAAGGKLELQYDVRRRRASWLGGM